MSKNLRHVAVVAGSTLGSRVLGLLRDILIFAVLGASLFNSAFLVAFTLPNLFRRLLGEGALTSAFVPVLSDELEEGGKPAGYLFLNRVLTRLFLLLLALTALGMGASWALRLVEGLPTRWYLVGELNLIMLPYMILICLAALLGACLNVLGRFAIPALSPILLNLSMLFFLGVLGWVFSDSLAVATLWLSMGVLFGGILQLLFPGWGLRREGWRPQWDMSADPALGKLMKILLPGLAGAAVLQVNILVGRVLAFTLEESAVALLYLASRLIELPLGVFAIAITTVVFPGLARCISNRDEEGFGQSLEEGLRLILAISLPAAIGLMVLGAPVLQVLFQYGAFGAGEVSETLPLLWIYAAGLPFYAATTFLVRAHHARKDMRSPLLAAVVVLFLNLILSLSLMGPYGAAGLALANVFSVLVQTLLLTWAMTRNAKYWSPFGMGTALMKIGLGAALLAGVCLLGNFLVGLADLGMRTEALLEVLILIPLAVVVYFGALLVLGFEELAGLRRLWRRADPPDGGAVS